MRYTSTRNRDISVSFETAIRSGYASDGGLFVPECLPHIPPAALLRASWSNLCYPDLMYEIVRRFIDAKEIAHDDLRQICHASMQAFENPMHAVPIVELLPINNHQSDDHNYNNNNSNHRTSNHSDLDSSSLLVVAELFHGPTFCFKDLSVRVLIRLLQYFAAKKQNRQPHHQQKHGQNLTLVVSTTGDTGPAVAQAVADLAITTTTSTSTTVNRHPNHPVKVSLLVHYPLGQISDFQQGQLTRFAAACPERIKVVAFEGGGDDMDRPIQRILLSLQQQRVNRNHQHVEEKKKEKKEDTSPDILDTDGEAMDKNGWVTGVNSYNIGRPILQTVHYVWTYLRVAEILKERKKKKRNTGSIKSETEATSTNDHDHDDNVDDELYQTGLTYIVPTGAMGNLVGGYMAKHMGLPIRKLVAAVNANDATHRVLQTGLLQERPMVATLSAAMNVQMPYNLERLFFYAAHQNHAWIRQQWTQQDRNDCNPNSSNHKILDLTAQTESLTKRLREDLDSTTASDADVCAAISNVFTQYEYYMDPHTAVGYCGAVQLGYTTSSTTASTTTTTTENDTPKSVVAIMATASPCKFEQAYRLALGDRGWSAYCASASYPPTAAAVVVSQTPPHLHSKIDDTDKDEDKDHEEGQEVILYTAHSSLEASQIAWERQSRDLIRKLHSN